MKASTLVVVVVVLKNDDWLMVSEKCDITQSFKIAVSLYRQRLTLFLSCSSTWCIGLQDVLTSTFYVKYNVVKDV